MKIFITFRTTRIGFIIMTLTNINNSETKKETLKTTLLAIF